jgi:hypothetical protein
MDEAQSVWTLIQSDYPNSVKHWREHSDLLAHAFAGVPFADVSEELIHRVQFGQSRESYSQFYRLTVDKHLTQLRALGAWLARNAHHNLASCNCYDLAGIFALRAEVHFAIATCFGSQQTPSLPVESLEQPKASFLRHDKRSLHSDLAVLDQ